MTDYMKAILDGHFENAPHDVEFILLLIDEFKTEIDDQNISNLLQFIHYKMSDEEIAKIFTRLCNLPFDNELPNWLTVRRRMLSYYEEKTRNEII